MPGTGRTIIGFLIGGGVLCFACAGYILYQSERHQMYLRNGRQALERFDGRGALIVAQQAVQDRPNDIQACRLMADVQDALDSPTVLTWRMRVVELEPANVRNYVSWAQTALKLANPGLALKALNSAPKERLSSADWQNLMGRTEVALGQAREADVSFNEAVRLEPANLLYQINLSSLRMESADASIAGEARRRLEELAHQGGPHGIAALRALLRDALDRNELDRAQTHAAEIEKRANASFDDDLLVLEARSRTVP
jgi:predicted Zn-dependent protease